MDLHAPKPHSRSNAAIQKEPPLATALLWLPYHTHTVPLSKDSVSLATMSPALTDYTTFTTTPHAQALPTCL